MPRTTGAPRRQVADSVRNKFWRHRDRSRSPRERTRQNFSLGPGGYPRRNWTPARCRWSSSVMRTTQGASFATNAANCVQTQTDRAPATPTPRPDRPQHSLHHFTDQRLRTFPRLTIASSPSAPPSDCSTRVALEASTRPRWRQRWFRLPLSPGAQSQQPSKQWGSAAAVAGGTISAWRTDPTTSRLVQR